MYKAVRITRGSGGWGGPLVVKADGKRNKILSVTGGGIHPVAAKLARWHSSSPKISMFPMLRSNA